MADKQFVADSAALLDIYKRAALLKANDERARKVILSGQVAMVYYSYRGQEILTMPPPSSARFDSASRSRARIAPARAMASCSIRTAVPSPARPGAGRAPAGRRARGERVRARTEGRAAGGDARGDPPSGDAGDRARAPSSDSPLPAPRGRHR